MNTKAVERETPMNHDEERVLRMTIITDLLSRDGQTVHGMTMRDYAHYLIKRHGPDRPFRQVGVLERFIRKLGREETIELSWGRSKNYDTVNAIALRNQDATEPKPRTVTRRTLASPDTITRRRMEILTTLEQQYGQVASVAILLEMITTKYRDHRQGTLQSDLKALEANKWITRAPSTTKSPDNRPRNGVEITGKGRHALTQWREHGAENAPILPNRTAPDGSREDKQPRRRKQSRSSAGSEANHGPSPTPADVLNHTNLVAEIQRIDAELQEHERASESLRARRVRVEELLNTARALESAIAEVFQQQ